LNLTKTIKNYDLTSVLLIVFSTQNKAFSENAQ